MDSTGRGSIPADQLTQAMGPENARALAEAYDTAVSIVSLGDHYFIPSREARKAMRSAMLADQDQWLRAGSADSCSAGVRQDG